MSLVSILLTGPAAASALRIALAADVTSMDPQAVNIAPNHNVAWHIYDALTNVDEHARLIPGLATAWRAVSSVSQAPITPASSFTSSTLPAPRASSSNP